MSHDPAVEDGSGLAGRRAIVTGAAQGLGSAYAVALAAAGAAVAICDVAPGIHDVEAQLKDYGVPVWASRADVSDPEQARQFVEGTVEQFGSIDIVVNNAGICIPTDPAHDGWEKAVHDCDATMGVNFKGEFFIGRAAIPHLIRQGGGDIVNVTTDHIHTCGWPVALNHADSQSCPWSASPRPPGGGPAFDLYDASKWALNGLTHAWARALRPHGIRVNSFGMGATDTPMYRGFLGDNPPAEGTMTPEAVAQVLIDLLAEGPGGRTGDSIQLWIGHPCVLPPVATNPPVVVL